MDCSPPGFSVHGIHSLLQGSLPDPGSKPWSLALQADSEPPGKHLKEGGREDSKTDPIKLSLALNPSGFFQIQCHPPEKLNESKLSLNISDANSCVSTLFIGAPP